MNEPLPTTDVCSPAACEPAGPVAPFALEGPQADEQLAGLAKALGHPTRVRILRQLIRHNACYCGDLAEQFDVAQSTVSQHLKILKDAGLIQGTVAGPKVCYCIDPAALRCLKVLVAAL